MKKMIFALVIILLAVLFLGIKYHQSKVYEKSEIEKANKDMTTKFSTVNNEEVTQGIDQVEDQVMENLPPQIEILYPSALKDGETIVTDKVLLKFSDDSKVTKATMNNQIVSTEEIRITTEGTYKVEIQDDANNKTTLTFTLKYKTQEIKTTPTKATTTPKTSKKTKETPKEIPKKVDEQTNEEIDEQTNEEINEEIDENLNEDSNITAE